MRRWLGIVAISVLLVVLMGTVACTRSKLGPAPTLAITGQVTAAVDQTPVPGKTVVAADLTPTESVGASPTPIPTMTPTTESGEAPTSTPEPTPTLSSEPVATPVPGAEFEYVVKTGDTLWGLALRFGTTIEDIKSRNQLTSDMIYKGDKLIVPGATADGESVTHVVQPGENLFRISLKYGTTIEAIAAANNLINPSFVYVGQELVIVKGGSVPSTETRYHVVQPGETLWSIAMRYGTTPWKIAAANGISNINFIYAGRTLRIP